MQLATLLKAVANIVPDTKENPWIRVSWQNTAVGNEIKRDIFGMIVVHF